MSRQRLGKILNKTRWLSMLLVVILGLGLTGCGDRPNFPSLSSSRSDAPSRPARIKEVAPPALIRDLRIELEQYQPQVQILSPRPGEVLQTQAVTVRLAVQDLPLFKDEATGLGSHLHVFLDDQPYQAIYDPSTPLVLENLTPGSHTIRAFASRPWHESFKNEGAFAETTFHVFTKTVEKTPTPNTPLLTYSRPQGSYGAEPIMLDFYLTQVPLHAIAQADDNDDVLDWTIRCTINGESFEIDEWRPLYLTGFKPGQNWVQLELLDEKGQAIANAFNDTVRVIDYSPKGQDALSQLVRNELPLDEARRIVIEGYEPPAPEPEVVPAVEEPTEEAVDGSVDQAAEEGSELPAADLELTDETQRTDEETTLTEPKADINEGAKPEAAITGTEDNLQPNTTGLEVEQELSPDEMPVEIVVPESPELETGEDSAIEAPLETVQEQFEAIKAEDPPEAAVPNLDESALSTDLQAKQSDEEIISPADSQAERSILSASSVDEAVENASEIPDEATAIAEQTHAFDQGSQSSVNVRDQDSSPIQNATSASASRSKGVSEAKETLAATSSDEPSVSQSSKATEVKPSPAINSYEAKAILEELEDLETEVEDLKGTVASAADQAASSGEPSSQIENLRSQLEQLKTTFGDTWERLSDFVHLKLQN